MVVMGRNIVSATCIAALSLSGCAATPEPRANGASARIIVRAAPRAATLQSSDDGEEWRHVCSTPCDRTMSTGGLYRVGGEGVTISRAFILSGPSTVQARTGSSSMYTAGGVLLGVGIPLTILGAFLAAVGGGGGAVSFGDLAIVGGATLFAGGIMTITGAALLSKQDTKVDVREQGPVAKLTFGF